jgi:hypothetical protein
MRDHDILARVCAGGGDAVKDERMGAFRLCFAIALLCAAAAYAFLLYPGLRADFSAAYHAYTILEKEKNAIAGVMLDPGGIEEKITDLQGQLVETRQIGTVTSVTVVDDIGGYLRHLDLELVSVTLGAPEAAGGVVTNEKQLVSLPVKITCRAPYDGGMYFLAALEESQSGTYRIDDFSFRTPAADAGETLDWNISVRLLYYGEL